MASVRGSSPQTTNESLCSISLPLHFLHAGRYLCFHNSPQLADASGNLGFSRYLQQTFYNAWRRHDLLFSRTVHSCSARQFPDSSYDRRKGFGFPEAEPFKLVPEYHRGLFCTVLFFYRRSGYWLDFLYTPEQHLFEFCCYACHYRDLCQRIFVDPYRPQFYSHHPHHARARLDLVSLAAFCLVDVCHQHNFHSRDFPWLPSPFRSSPSNASFILVSSTLLSAAIRFSSSISSGLFAPSRLHHGPACDWRASPYTG